MLPYKQKMPLQQSFPNVVGLTGKIVVGPTNYDLFLDQMSDVFRDRFHDLYFLIMRNYKE
jgi:hypothetical protein